MSVAVTKADGVATVLLNRSEKLNALSGEMYHALADHFADLGRDDEVRAVILTGAGRAFCSGGDVTGMAKSDIVSGRARSQRRHRAILADLPMPWTRRTSVPPVATDEGVGAPLEFSGC